MPKTTTSPAVTAASTVVFTDDTLRKASDLTVDSYRPLWTGPSGEQSSGEAVARHLEAAIAVLDKDGWVRVYDYSSNRSTSTDIADDDSMTVKAMLKSLLRLFREELDDRGEGRRNLYSALRQVAEAGVDGDTDTADIATNVLTLIVRAHTGSDSASATPWSERLHRTHADITALLRAGARFARTYGPGATGDQEHAA